MTGETELERMVIRLVGDATSYLRAIKEAQAVTVQTVPQIQREVQKVGAEMAKSSDQAVVFGNIIDNLGTKMSNVAGQFRAMAALESPFGFLKESVALAGQAERTQVDFGTMLQSAKEGEKLTAALVKFSAETPLNMPDIKQGTKTLLQFGEAADSVIPTLRMIGDVALGDAEKVRRMVLAFGQVRGVGHVQGDELNQMIEAGFNPLREMARTRSQTSGKGMEEELGNLMKMKEQGKITFDMLKEAFKTATAEGGQFHDGMKKASKTFEGLASTAKDDIGAFKTAVGETIIEQFHLKDALGLVSDAAKFMTESFKGLPPELKFTTSAVVALTAAFGSLILVWKVGSITTGIVVGVMTHMVVTTKTITAATWEFIAALRTKGIVMQADALGVSQVAVAHRGATAAIIAFKAAAVAASAYVGYQIGRLLQEEIYGTEKALQRLDGALFDLGQRGAVANRKFTQVLSEIVGGTNDAGELKTMIKSLELSKKASEEALESARRNLEREKSESLKETEAVLPVAAAATWLIGRKTIAKTLNDQFDLAQDDIRLAAQGIKDAEASLEANTKNLEAAKARLQEIQKQAAGDPKSTAKADEYIKKLQIEAATYGMAKHAAEAYKLSLEGLSAAKKIDLAFAAEEADTQDQLRQQRKDRERDMENSKKYVEDLRREIAYFDKDSRAKRISELTGADNRANAYQLSQELKGLEEKKKLMEEGKNLTQELRTPQMKFDDQVKHLRSLLEVGAISHTIFATGIKNARDELDKATKATHQMTSAIQQLDYVMGSSPEARRRIEAQENLIRGMGAINQVTGSVNRSIARTQGSGASPVDVARDRRDDQHQKKVEVVLGAIKDSLTDIRRNTAKTSGVTLQEANL